MAVRWGTAVVKGYFNGWRQLIGWQRYLFINKRFILDMDAVDSHGGTSLSSRELNVLL